MICQNCKKGIIDTRWARTNFCSLNCWDISTYKPDPYTHLQKDGEPTFTKEDFKNMAASGNDNAWNKRYYIKPRLNYDL